jgi:hypothetical protein
MTDEPVKAMGGGCLGGLLGAVLGIVIGGFVGPVIATSKNDLRNNPDPFAKQVSGAFDGCAGFFGMLFGAGIGGIIGGVGGSVLGAGLAAKASSTPKDEPPRANDCRPANGSEPPTESPDAELARLRARVAEFEGEKQKDDRSKEQ